MSELIIKTSIEQFADTKEQITVFTLRDNEAMAAGFIHDKKICIHHIHAKNRMKEIMNALVNKFSLRDFRFLMVINPELKNIVRGEVVMIPPDAKGNPFGEWIEEIHGHWECADNNNYADAIKGDGEK